MRIVQSVFFAVLLVVASLAQTSPPNQVNTAIPIDASQITMPVFATNPAPAVGATLAIVGNPGPRTDYYWIVANYLAGSASVAGPFLITHAPNTRSVSNYVTINPSFSGPGVLTYDVLRTTAPIAPSGSCTCAVATSVAVGTVTNDQTGALSSYTVNPVNVAALNVTLQNEVQSAGVSHLILRQNGVLVCDLSAGCGSGYTLPTQYTKLRCESGLGDGLNSIAAGTYLQTFCYNDSGVTWTISGIRCYSDNAGSSTLNATDNLSNALLTAAITCSTSFAAGTQSSTVTIASGGYIKFTFVADGASKQSTWVVSLAQ